MENERKNLELSPEEEKTFPQGLVQMGEDLFNDPEMTREDIVKLYMVSQQNCRMMMQRLEERKNLKAVELSPETLAKLKRFMDASRVHPLAGGQRFKSEDETIDFLFNLALKFGFEFLEAMLNAANFQSVTSSMKEEVYEDPNERKKEVSGALEEAEENG